jgi:uncharacterized protein (TIGR03382 family)
VDSKAGAVNRGWLLLVALALPASAQVVAGSYRGDGTSGRRIETLVTPKWVWVKKENNGNATRTVVRTATMNGTLSKTINSSLASGVLDAGIVAIEAGGFRVGDLVEVNAAGELYWFVVGIESPSSAVGSYAGDGQSGRLIPTPASGGIDIDGGGGRINSNGIEIVYVALGGATLLPDGGVLGDPSVLQADAGASGTDGGVGRPRDLQVGCACGSSSPALALPLLLLLWGRGLRRN